MKVPLRWLADYVELPESVAALCERLTLAGLEVAGVRPIGLPVPPGLHVKAEEAGPVWDRDKIVAGRILSVERHPNADRLTLATVDYGAATPRTVVTGAPNLKPGHSGQGVVVALSGAVLYDGHADTKVLRELKPGKIRGVLSDAMVCSGYELGISEDHEGIILLDEDIASGTPLADVMGDIVIELDVLPNMARCLSVIGVAREVAALTGKALRLPDYTVKAAPEPVAGKVEVVIQDPSLCARYAAGLLRGAASGQAPGWMRRRLSYAGMRPISNLVDVTNYVMLEWGQPLHAFDMDVLRRRAGGKTPVITVRRARRGEKIKTLDGVERELATDTLVIADVAGPVAIAGVMGGAETEVSDRTQNILLESANFDFVSVRATMKALNLPSEASVRFSKGIHPELVKPAAKRALKMMVEHAGATVLDGLVDNYPRPLAPKVIELKAAEIRRVLGFDLGLEEATRILRALEFKVESAGPGALQVTPPPHRLDIQAGAADLIEELVRIHGYDRLPATLLADQLPEPRGNRSLEFEERVRDILVDAGLQEVITYSLTEPAREAPLGLAEQPYVELKNPISSERTVMRHSVLTGVLEVAAGNLRHTEDVCLFEIGRVYLPRPDAKLPDEPRRLAMFLAGRSHVESWADAGASSRPLDFFDLKGTVEAIFRELHVEGVTYRPSQVAWLHPGRAAEVLVGDLPVGSFGQMHPRAAAAYGLGSRAVLVGELDLEAIMAAVPERYAYRPVPRFPAALRDVAVIVDEKIAADRIVTEIHAAGGDLLAAVRVFDVYRGESIPAGTKSLAYALTYQAEDRTLTDKEVDRAHKKITDRLKHVLAAQIRGQEEALS